MNSMLANLLSILLLIQGLCYSAKMENYTWSPLDLKVKNKFTLGNYALVVLNRPITLESKEMTSLWKEASLRATVDGGTNRWFDFIEKNDLELENKFPDIISGDFDSVSPELLKACKENGSYVEQTPDQNYTDFTKSLKVIKKRYNKQLDSLLVVIGDSGRLDHTFSNLNTLHEAANSIFKESKTSVYLLNTAALTWLLQPGNHKLSIPGYLRNEHEWCAILPFLPVKNSIKTTGLKWNLDNQSVEFGGLISSSNTYDDESEEVTLTTDTEIIWSMGIGKEN